MSRIQECIDNIAGVNVNSMAQNSNTARQNTSIAGTEPQSGAPKQGAEYVNDPPHYASRCTEREFKAILERMKNRGYMEAIDVIDAFKLDFDLAQNVRYVLRLGEKDDPIIELGKAEWYLKHKKEMLKLAENV